MLDVYPTHRTVGIPQRVLDNTLKNATGAKTVNEGRRPRERAPRDSLPMPKTGSEAIWNHLLRYSGLGYDGSRYENWNVDSAGVPALAVRADAYWAWPIYDPKHAASVISGTEPFWYNKLLYVGPARRNGEALLIIDSVNPAMQPRKAWQYLPGPAPREARPRPRVRHAQPPARPARARTTTCRCSTARSTASNGSSPARKRCTCRTAALPPHLPQGRGRHHHAAPHQPGPRALELHRVWVVEAQLKPGKRHIYAKRTFYLDEDSWTALASDQYDARGQLYRSSFAYQSYSYDVQAPFGDTFAIYDFNSGAYNITGLFGANQGLRYMTQLPRESAWAPEALAGAGLR